MFGALKHGFRSLATLKLVVNIVGELQTDKNSCGIARFPCDSTAFLSRYSTRSTLDKPLAVFIGILPVMLTRPHGTGSRSGSARPRTKLER